MNVNMPAAGVPSYRLYRERSGESGNFWLHCETIPERTRLHNWEIAVHRHDAFFQVFLLTSGSGELLGAPHPIALRAPCAIFIPAGLAHGFRYARDVDGLVLTALADRLRPVAASDRTVASFTEDLRIVPLGDDEEIAALVGSIHAEMSGRSVGKSMLLEALMAAAVIRLVRIALPETIEDGAAADARDAHLEMLVAAHHREHRPMRFYADALGVSVTHLNRIARTGGGLSVSERVAERLVEAAKRELIFTPGTVETIAYGLGFHDPAYFNRFFRRRVGTTPGAFRDQERRRLAG